jgi:hypothetical protein
MKGSPEPSPKGSPGVYDFLFVLGIPGTDSVLSAINLKAVAASGDSLIASNDLRIEAASEQGSLAEAVFHSNREGRLASVSMRIEANSFIEAERFGHEFVSPVLSALSFHADVAVEVRATIITEVATGIRTIGAVSVGKVKPFDIGNHPSTEDVRSILSAYREAISSNSPLYQVLCLYKIIEGLGARGERHRRGAKKAGTTPPEDPMALSIPADLKSLPEMDNWALNLFLPYLGKTFAEMQAAFKDTYRNAIAHLINDDILVFDRFDDLRQCREAIPVLRFVCRAMIESELKHACKVHGDRNSSSSPGGTN